MAPPPPPPPSPRFPRWVIGAIAGVVVLAVVATVIWRIWPTSATTAPTVAPGSSAPVSTASASPTAAQPTGIPTGRGGQAQPGQTISVPPVPAPTATTQRNNNAPDRPTVAVPAVKPAGFVDPPPGAGLDRYVKQTVTWRECKRGDTVAECATVSVPLDYAKPDGQAITLSLLRIKATETRIGSLFVNPGGPGSGGTDLAARFKNDGLGMYDIVGWDPRGTGDSTPVVCRNGASVDALRSLDESPDTPEELAALKEGWRQFALGCLEKSGPLLFHITTLDTVADLDLLRQLLGDKQVNYFGYSYGTEIGAVYAEKYAANVGRMVLDSAVNITRDESVVQATGFDTALRNYAQWCATTGCALGGKTADDNLKVIVDLFEKLDAQPLTVGNRKLTQTLAVEGVLLFLYFDETSWGNLTNRIIAAKNGNGSALLQAADAVRDRKADGTYDTGYFAFWAINCADYRDDGIDRAIKDWQADQKAAPIFGKYFGPGLACVQWPVQGTAPFDIRGKGAKPIVVVGATGDSATPYQYAVWMAQQLESGVLVTYDGAGHATYGNDRSSCVDAMVVAYFARDEVPPYGLFCTS